MNQDQLNEALCRDCEYGNLGEAKELIEKGAPVNAKDEYGYTPLHWAVSHGHLEIAELLIEHDADVNMKTDGGCTTIFLAEESYQAANYFGHDEKIIERDKKIIELLKKHGAKQ